MCDSNVKITPYNLSVELKNRIHFRYKIITAHPSYSIVVYNFFIPTSNYTLKACQGKQIIATSTKYSVEIFHKRSVYCFGQILQEVFSRNLHKCRTRKNPSPKRHFTNIKNARLTSDLFA